MRLLLSLYCVFCLQISASYGADYFFEKFPQPLYQDILIKNLSLCRGTNICPPRYDLIKPILQKLQKPFTVLDLGAAQGYFSFRIARDFPEACCVMIEDNTAYYGNHGDALYDLCLLNQFDNVFFLRKKFELQDLYYLNNYERFDVVLAFLVIHQMEQSLDRQILIVESLLKLGDLVIIEVANDVAVPLTDFVDSLSKKLDCTYLGELPRIYASSNGTGRFYCFRGLAASAAEKRQGISRETFEKLNGVYP